MRFFEKTKGAISIFLVIILVPMMTVSSLFVDAGRVKLAQGVASSAGDLALNTALTSYDTLLKDMYGLFATAQDTDDAYEKLEDYYKTCIVSAGISDEDADDCVEWAMQKLNGLMSEDEETADLLNMQLSDFTVEKVSGANLANATLLKKQVVEFMKYRAPINTGLSFLTSLQSFANLSKETALVDKRQEYYKAEQTVMEEAQKAWKYINEYNKSPWLTNSSYFTAMETNLNSYSGAYKEIHTKTVKDLYDTQNYDVFNASILTFEEGTITGEDGTTETVMMLYINKDKTNRETDYSGLTEYSETQRATADDLKSALNNCHAAYNAVETAIEQLLVSDANTYGLQFVVQTNRRGLYSQYVSAVKKYYECYQKVIRAFKYQEDNAEDTSEKLWGNATKTYQKYYDDVSNDFATFAGSFNDKHSAINSELDRFENTIGEKTSTTDTNNKIVNIYNEITKYRAALETAKKNLEDAKTCLDGIVGMIKPDGELAAKKKAWSDAAKDESLNNSTMAKQDRAEIEELDMHINQGDVEKLIARCANIITGLNNLIQEIDKYQYAGTSICEIYDYAAFKYVVGTKYGDEQLKRITYNGTELDKQIADWWNAGVFTAGTIDISWMGKDKENVDLSKGEKKFYTYLYTHFYQEDSNATAQESNATEQKNTYKNIKSSLSKGAENKNSEADKKAEEDKKNNASSDNEIKDQKNLPSKAEEESESKSTASASVDTDADSAAKNASGSLSMFEVLADIGETVRDDLYYADYVLSMFSYDTYEKEAKYDALPSDKKKSSVLVSGSSMPEGVKLESITKNPIDKDHNYAYGSEVEYVIYGGENDTNKTKAYGTIFVIRLGFNLIYGFTNSEIKNGANSIAIPISAATLGVIPVPLIQAGIIIGICIAESSIDLMCLREGMKVPLYKDKGTWNISIDNLIGNLGAAAKNLVQPLAEKAIDKGVECLDSWLDKTEEELKDMSEEKIAELQKSVDASFKQMVEEQAGIVMQKVTTAIEDEMEAGTTAEEKMVENVSEKLDTWLASVTEDKESEIYKVKEQAVASLKEQGGTYIKEIFNGMKEASQAATTEASEKLYKIFNNISEELEKKANKAISEILSKTKEKVKEAAKKGATELKEALNEGVNQLFGKEKTTIDANGASSLIAFQYSDYLRLFLIIGLLTNEENVVLRTADVIQVNMAQKLKKDNTGYKLSNSAVYVKIEAKVAVKPILLGLPLFTDVENNPKDNTNWYTIEYSDIRGY